MPPNYVAKIKHDTGLKRREGSQGFGTMQETDKLFTHPNSFFETQTGVRRSLDSWRLTTLALSR